jgi:hypothetical protein
MLRHLFLLFAFIFAVPALAQDYQSTLGPDNLTPRYPIVEGTKGWTAAMGSVCNPHMPYAWRTASGGRHRFEIHNTTSDRGCFGDPSTKRRSELHRKKTYPFGVVHWGAFAFKDQWSDPAGMKARGKAGTIIQMHSSSGSPTFAFRRIGDGRLRITTTQSGDNKTRYTSAAAPAFNVPHDVVYRFKIGTRGELDVWLDGKQVLKFRGVVGRDNNNSYWCFGPYFASGMTGVIVQEFAHQVYPQTASLGARIAAPPGW